MAKTRANDRGANDDAEDGYLDETKSDKKGYENDPTDKPTPVAIRAPQSNPFFQGGNWFRSTVIRKDRKPCFKSLTEKHYQTLITQ